MNRGHSIGAGARGCNPYANILWHYIASPKTSIQQYQCLGSREPLNPVRILCQNVKLGQRYEFRKPVDQAPADAKIAAPTIPASHLPIIFAIFPNFIRLWPSFESHVPTDRGASNRLPNRIAEPSPQILLRGLPTQSMLIPGGSARRSSGAAGSTRPGGLTAPLKARFARRLLEQQTGEPPLREPQQELHRKPQQQQRVSRIPHVRSPEPVSPGGRRARKRASRGGHDEPRPGVFLARSSPGRDAGPFLAGSGVDPGNIWRLHGCRLSSHELRHRGSDSLRRSFDVAVGEMGLAQRHLHIAEWPSRRETTGNGTPFITAWLAIVWRRS